MTWGRVVPFIATLAMLTIARGLALTITGGRAGPHRGRGVHRRRCAGGSSTRSPTSSSSSPRSWPLGWFGLNRTVFGRQIYAVGGNRVAARLSGIPVRRTSLRVYAISGLCAGIAAVLVSARTGDRPAERRARATSSTLSPPSWSAASSLFGGRGSIVGTLYGVLILTMITNIFVLQNMSYDAQLIVKGAIILAAVMLQRRAEQEE